MTNQVEYIYDGTFEGFLCCIYESLFHREIPQHIYAETGEPLLGETATWVSTDWEKAQRVFVSMEKKIGLEAQDMVRDAFLTHMIDKERILYRYIMLGYKIGRPIVSREEWGEDPDTFCPGRVSGEIPQLSVYQRELILKVMQVVQNYRAEVKNAEGAMQFRSYPDVMISCITPKNRILPGLTSFFEKRFGKVNFLLYDKTHQMAAVHREEGTMVTSMQNIHLPVLYDEANVYENLWKSWFDRMQILLPANPRYALNEMRAPLWCELGGTG